MKPINLSRYDDHQLDSMLYSYERLAELHARQGHYALAKWANTMRVTITVELNERQTRMADMIDRQQPLFDNSTPR